MSTTTNKIPKTKGQLVLIGMTLLYLAAIIFVPAVAVFYEAFHKGIEPFLTSVQTRDFIEAVKLTAIIALIAVPLNTIFGLCAAWAIARRQFPGRTFLISLIDLPFSISPVVAGLMIVLLYGRVGWLGPWLQANDIRIIFALPGMVLATIFVTLPFVAREVIPVLEEIGPEQEEAARTLGASDWQIFWRVTLPSIRWALMYGVLLTNARAMGEFGAVSVVSGSILGRTSTLPIFVEQAYKNYQTEAAFSAAVILGLLAGVTLVIKEILERKTARKISDN
ncbi:MAG: Sulfate transport system permease protein CysW [Chroococcopsis gigantea SAG 12.99]|jgi:sulfate transport system permease protein|nr:sulfate ABC transporter permease subunit CysW [Chlorogloea purpurea SAG 13.99]MDV3001725.1 Sulfate transport system permease protein CysW [Chroococcopsis gigantea SAG 12.99]